MKEITRIHIAKISYDVEVEAKKELENYLRTLEAYSDDAEIIDDIEIRITEILLERGVSKNGVITIDDVKALKDQLGEPKDFMGDGDIAIGPEDTAQMGFNSRKLFRNPDNAVIGGVLSGIGAFFNVNPLWIRLLFIVLLLASFGTALLVYVVLWIVVPAAKTAADKLQMNGRPVTIASIREINEGSEERSVTVPGGRRVLSFMLGIISTFIAVGCFIFIAVVILGFTRSSLIGNNWPEEVSGFLIAAFSSGAASGLLLGILFLLGAYAAFTQKITKRVWVSAIIVIVLGLTSFGAAIGFGQYAATMQQRIVDENTHQISIALPNNTKTAMSLSISAPSFNVRYIADTDEPHAEMRVITQKGVAVPKVTVKMDGTKLVISADKNDVQRICYWPGCDGSQQTITIYGPAVQSIEAQEQSYVVYSPLNQPKLELNAKKDATLNVGEGTVENLEIKAADDTTISTDNATVVHATIELASGANASFGTTQDINVIHSNSCPSGMQSRVSLWSTGSLTVNGTTQPLQSTNLTCMRLEIEGERNDRT